jgi:hypothetical protein
MSPWKGRNFGGGSSIFGPPIPGAIGGASVVTRERVSPSRRNAEDFAIRSTDAFLLDAVGVFVTGVGEG